MGKTDLNRFKRPAASAPVLGQSPATSETPSKPKATKPSKPKKSPAKPKVDPKEVCSKRLQVLLTEDEFAALNKARGDVPISRFVRRLMKEKKLI